MEANGSVTSTKGSGRVQLLSPLRLRDFRLLWTGMVVSLVGDGMFLVAIAWQVYELSNAPTALSIVGIAMSLPHILLLLLGGVVSDRFDRRTVMIFADLVRGAAVGALGVLSISGTIEVWHIAAFAALYGAGTAFFGPSFDAIVPELVPAEELTQANSLDQFVRPAAWYLAGPALGGLVIGAWGLGIALLLDAGTFAVSIAALAMMRRRPRIQKTEDESSLLDDAAEGFRFIRSQVWLWGTFLAATCAYLLFLGPIEVLLPFVVKNEMGGSAQDLGFILAVGGIGSISAAIFVSRRGVPRRNMTFIYICWTVSTLAVAGYGLARVPWQAMIAAFIFGSLESAGLIAWATTKQRLVPGPLLGRVSSLDWFISIGLVPLSYALTGPIAELLGARTTLIAAGTLGGAVTFGFLFLPGMRDIEQGGSIHTRALQRAAADFARHMRQGVSSAKHLESQILVAVEAGLIEARAGTELVKEAEEIAETLEAVQRRVGSTEAPNGRAQ
ncbi:MAG: MFS transporter [Acidimicrobiia bacterium]